MSNFDRQRAVRAALASASGKNVTLIVGAGANVTGTLEGSVDVKDSGGFNVDSILQIKDANGAVWSLLADDVVAVSVAD